MTEPLDELYFTWLYGQVWNVRQRTRARSYWSLARRLFTTEFVWIVPNDDNRVEDGRDLRQEFLADSGVQEVDADWMALPCSFFEMMLALSRRLAFEAEGEPREWFLELVDNLELLDFNDSKYRDEDDEYIKDLLETVVWRTYHPTGEGGLFPLKEAHEDQRDVEIWYQLCAYLLEREHRW